MQQNLLQQEIQDLNQDQLQAVETIYGPVMVVAGPGTGKTQIIALRTANIILQTGINPENILITTFTEAGVIAIKKRLQKFLGSDSNKVKVTTFHAFASEVISDFPDKFIEKRALKVIDDIESFEILSTIIEEKISNNDITQLFSTIDRFAYLRDIKDRISKLKSEGVSPKSFTQIINNLQEEYTQKLLDLEFNKRIRDLEKRRQKDKESYDKHIKKLQELQSVFSEYQEKIQELGYFDFADMITFVTDKFKNDEDILAFYAEKYQFIMIDEFQDTNNAQNTIIDMILSYNKQEQNIMVVGDDDQSIYRFQGANIENMLDFITKYPNTKNIVLTNNYRSSQDILNLSKNLIENNEGRISNRVKSIDKNIVAKGANKDKKENHFYMLENDLKEKLFVYNQIKKLNNPNTTFAIIVKKNKQVEEWSNFLKGRGLQVISKNNANILNNHFVLLLIDFLSFIQDPYFDDAKLLDMLRSDLCNIENIDVLFLSRNLYQKNYSRQKFKLGLWDIIKDIEENDFLKENVKNIQKIIDFKLDILKLQSDLGNLGITGLIRNILDYLSIFDYVEKYGNFNDLQDIFTFVNKVKNYIENNKDINLKNILNKFELYKTFSLPINRDAIHSTNSNIEILTAHSSKGLEFDYVFLPEVYEGNWSSRAISDKLKLPLGISGKGLQYADIDEKEIKEIEKNISKEEERRLFFVALTRAKSGVILTLPNSKTNKLLVQSTFVLETGIIPEKIDLEISELETRELLISDMLGNPLIKTTKEEINFIENFLKTYKLSPTDFNKFSQDPKQFLRDVIFKYPFLSNENLMFGSAYHKVLEQSTIEKKKGNIISLENMKTIFTQEIKKYDLNGEELQRLLKRGIEGLEGYYELFKNNSREIYGSEINFRYKDIYFEGIPLTGKIDKIEIIGEGSSDNIFDGQGSLFYQQLALVDYKTGSVKTIGTIKGIDRDGNKKQGEGGYFKQLLFYKLMVELSSDFKNTFQVGELALDFVEGKNGEYKYTPVPFNNEEYNEFKQELKDAWQKISDIEFWKEVLEG